MISYLREESVSISIDLLNDTEIRPGFKIKIEPAKFEQKGEYKERNALKLGEIERKKLESEKERLLGWEEEDQAKGLKIIVLKNLFSPEEFIEDPSFRNDLELDMIEECENSFGEIEKIQIFEENPQGILKIKFRTAVAAEKAIQVNNY
jgi:HIV Tat-specific factor 1